MKIKRIKWYRPLGPDLSCADCGYIQLECRRLYWQGKSDEYPWEYYNLARWRCYAKLGWNIKISGPIRRSAELAKKDGENLVKQLLLDIRDGTKRLMKYYGVDNDE